MGEATAVPVERKRRVTHYRIAKGTACHVRHRGGEWAPYTTSKPLWFAERVEESDAGMVFAYGGWELRVPTESVRGSAVAKTPVLLFDGAVVLTRELLHAGLNVGSINRKQAAALGLTYPVAKGWLSAMVGTTVSQEAYQQFLSLRRPPRGNRTPKGDGE